MKTLVSLFSAGLLAGSAWAGAPAKTPPAPSPKKVAAPAASTAEASPAPTASAPAAGGAQEASNPAPLHIVTLAPSGASDGSPDLRASLTPSAPVGPVGALWRSALLPGWGQFASHRKLEGVICAGATAALLGVTIYEGVQANQANTIYEQALPSQRAAAFDQAHTYANRRNLFIGLTLGSWMLNAAESFLLHPKVFGPGSADASH